MSINDSKIEFIEDGQLTDLAGGGAARSIQRRTFNDAGIGCSVPLGHLAKAKNAMWPGQFQPGICGPAAYTHAT